MYYLINDSKNIIILNTYLLNQPYIVYNVSNKNKYIDTINYYPHLKIYKLITKMIKLQYYENKKYILLLFEDDKCIENLINDINKNIISVEKYKAKESYEITTMKLVDFNNKYDKSVILNNKDLSEDWLELHRYNDFARKNYEDIEEWSEDIFIKDAKYHFSGENINLPILDELLPYEMRIKLQ